MKRLLLGISVGLAMSIGALIGLPAQIARAFDTNNFTISAFDAEYYLDKDSENRSTLKTVERITAVFPAFNQNHGLERALPDNYDGHSTSLQIESVKGSTGENLSYGTTNSNGNLVLRIGNKNKYVHGEHTYVITYTQRDVTRFFSDTNADEFYWDVNGTGWAQPMGQVRARVHVPATLDDNFTEQASCYVGAEGSTTTCPINRQPDENGTVFDVQMNNLMPHENVTFAIGFKPNTFAGYQLSWQERMWATLLIVWPILLVLGSVVALVLLVRMSISYYKLMHRIKGRGTIVPEYLPPKNMSVLVSAHVLGNATSDITAQLIDLAVRHYLKIYQTKDKTLLKPAEYEIEIVKDTADLQKEEQRLLKDLFGNAGVTPGSRFNMATIRKKYALAAKLMAGRNAVQKSTRSEYALYEHAEKEAGRFRKNGFILLWIGILTFSPFVVIVSIVAFFFAGFAWPLTQKGVEFREYLLGLKMYISVAEQERIKMLQSPEGAEKVGVHVDGKDSAQLVKLYERVLPYAVLFNIEKEWTKQLGAYYETTGQQPDWYSGNAVFNAAVFSGSLSSFTSQSSSYSSSTSASSGGSSGGGSSGGGGGGGGGGGW